MATILEKLVEGRIGDATKIDGSFRIESRLALAANQGVIEFEVVPTEPWTKRYEHDDPDDIASYIAADDKHALIAYHNDMPAGLLLVSENWNGHAIIDTIKVDLVHRKAGIGRMLADAAVAWAKSRNLYGIMLETQDNNVSACLFYKRYGFVLRGFDTGLYSAIPATRDETALFWYLDF